MNRDFKTPNSDTWLGDNKADLGKAMLYPDNYNIHIGIPDTSPRGWCMWSGIKSVFPF